MPRWDNLARQRQAELCRLNRPWTRSCGPKSDYGKLIASQNAKHHRRFRVVPCDLVQESETLVQALEGIPECHSDVTVQKTRDIQIGDRAVYTGADPAITSICGGKMLEIFALCEGWARCWVPNFPGLITVPVIDLLQQG